MNRPTRRFGLAVAAGLAVSVLALGGCAATTTESDESSSGDGAAYSEDAIATFTSFTGGAAGEATGEPIKLGWINSQGGAQDFSQYTVSAEAAVELINTQLGGVDGRPIELVECFVGDADEQGQVCGQQFLNDSDVVGIVSGSLVSGNATFHQTLDGQVPVLGTIANDANDAASENSYYLASGQFGIMGVVTYASEFLKADTVAMTAPAGIAVVQELTAGLTAAFEGAGITVTQSTYDGGGTDYSAALLASGAGDADMFMAITGTPNQCSSIAQGLTTLGITTPTVGFDTCLSEAVQGVLGDYAQWTYQGQAVNVSAGSSDPETEAQIAAYDEWVAASDAEDSQDAVFTLQLLLSATQVLNSTSDDITRDSVSAALASYTGPAFLGLGDLSFGSIPGLGAIGTFASRAYTYEGDGAWTDATDGELIMPPAN